MKEGRSLVELAGELERQQTSKRDFLADTRSLKMAVGGDIEVSNGKAETFKTTDHCHGQIGSRLNIPKKYYDRMRAEAPELLAHNVNEWFQRKPERRMVRTLDGRARAFLAAGIESGRPPCQAGRNPSQTKLPGSGGLLSAPRAPRARTPRLTGAGGSGRLLGSTDRSHFQRCLAHGHRWPA